MNDAVSAGFVPCVEFPILVALTLATTGATKATTVSSIFDEPLHLQPNLSSREKVFISSPSQGEDKGEGGTYLSESC